MSATDWQRRPGEGRYAQPERERRFLLRADPPAGSSTRSIEDRYVDGTRLRLRHVSDGKADVYKLTQKVRVDEDDPGDVRITNTYLSRAEYDVLRALPASVISKIRSVHRHGTHDFAVDVFQQRLHGLRLAELELASIDEAIELPPWLGQDVTADNRYTGGFLAQASDAEVRSLIGGCPRGV